MKTVLDFSRIEDFETSIILAIITSVPRWGFAQSLGANVGKKGELSGTSRATSKFPDLTRRIVRGEGRLTYGFGGNETPIAQSGSEIKTAVPPMFD